MASPQAGSLVDHAFRHQAGRILARLTRVLGPAHLDLAEDAVQEAMIRALLAWPGQGVPDNPAGWLFRVAHNIAIDAVRRNRTFGAVAEHLVREIARSAAPSSPDVDGAGRLQDDELRMIFMCCHPELPRDAAVALSLKTIGGFSVHEIARAFLAEESAIAQRVVRAKRLIRDRRLGLELPGERDLAARLDSVLEVLYLMFNEGYAAHDGEDLLRTDLCLEALRLGQLVATAPGALPRVHALVALMAFQAARLAARVDEAGNLVLLADQDRGRWDERLIAVGFHHFDRSIAGDEVSAYHVQAAIAATHARAIDPESLDWPLILSLYDQLLAINPSPVVRLNRAVAVARVRGPGEALAEIEPLERDPVLRLYHLRLAVRGQLLFELGRRAEAVTCFRAALDCHCSAPERRFLQRKLDQVAGVV